jgi:hypothetical protein
MKIRNGFVSNSSATAFIIENISDSEKTMRDFVEECIHLLDDYLRYYDWHKPEEGYTRERMLEDAERSYHEVFEPGEAKVCEFGDEHGTILGAVFDYMLREHKGSESFKCRFFETRR